MRSAFTVMPRTMSVKRRSMWSRARKLSGTITRSTDEWLMSRSCQSATFSRAASALARTSAREARDLLAADRVALVRHGRAALLALAERLLHLAHLGLLQRADLGRELLQAGGQDRERRHHLGVAVALQDLRRDGRRLRGRAARTPPPRRRAAGARRCRPRPRACPPRSSRGRAPARSRSRASSAYQSASFRPKVMGSACTPWVRPIIGVCLVLGARASCTASRSAVQVREDQVAGVAHQHRERGVDHVRGGEAVVEPAPLGPDVLGHVRDERDHVVLDFLLDRVDARDVEARPLLDGLEGFPRHDPALGQHLGGGDLDLEPGREAVLVGPEPGHLGPGVAGDHARGRAKSITRPKSIAEAARLTAACS